MNVFACLDEASCPINISLSRMYTGWHSVVNEWARREQFLQLDCNYHMKTLEKALGSSVTFWKSSTSSNLSKFSITSKAFSTFRNIQFLKSEKYNQSLKPSRFLSFMRILEFTLAMEFGHDQGTVEHTHTSNRDVGVPWPQRSVQKC